MYIVIAGAGTVGYNLAKILSNKHSVVIVDKDYDKLSKLNEELDVLTIHGDIERPQTFRNINLSKIELYIAVSNSDEANLLSSLIIDDVVAIDRKMLRLKNDGFLHSGILEKLSINYAVFPNLETAKKVQALLEFPRSNNVKTFYQGSFKLISIRAESIEDGSYFVKDFESNEVKIVGIERNKEFFIPNFDSKIEKNDLLYFCGDGLSIREIAKKIDNSMPQKIEKVVIFGANDLAQKIASKLLEKDIKIKIIEKSPDLCNEALHNLEGRVEVINSVYEDHKLFEEEGLSSADMIIASYYSDEKNIIKCMEAKEFGIKKVVAVNNDKGYYDLMHKLGLIVVRGSKASAYFSILEHLSFNSIVTQSLYCGGRGVMFIRKIFSNSELIGKSPSSFKIDNAGIILFRDKDIKAIDDELFFKEGDIVVVYGEIAKAEELEKWIYKL